jgi:tetratricopeptide (TPR) repeat protein
MGRGNGRSSLSANRHHGQSGLVSKFKDDACGEQDSGVGNVLQAARKPALPCVRRARRKALSALFAMMAVTLAMLPLHSCTKSEAPYGGFESPSGAQMPNDASTLEGGRPIITSEMSESERRQALYDSGRVAFNPEADLNGLMGSAQDKAAEIRANATPDKIAASLGILVSDWEEEFDKTASVFAAGNSYYRNGDYESAIANYERAIKYAPLHYGSRVNIALAYLQLGDGATASHDGMKAAGLRYAVEALALWPGDLGCLMNLQVAAVANGYDTWDLRYAPPSLFGAYDYDELMILTRSESSDYYVALAFNDSYSLIERTFAANADNPQLAYELQRVMGSSANEPYYQDLIAYLNAYAKVFSPGIETY